MLRRFLVLSLPMVLIGTGCSVDVPPLDDNSVAFACNDNVHCADGYGCDGGTCRAYCGDHFCDTAGGDTIAYSTGCFAQSCSERGWNCGAIFDHCGRWERCGTCMGTDSCGAFAPGQCGNGPPPGSPSNPAQSCLDILSMAGGEGVADGAFTVSISSGTSMSIFCDMTRDGGGWTLAGQIDGRHDMANSWLRQDMQTQNLSSRDIESNTFSCANAVDMAVNRAREVRLSNSSIDRWVKWLLPDNRTVNDFWSMNAGQATIASSPTPQIEVVGWDARRGTCFQNKFGIMPFYQHGGSYPYASQNYDGNTTSSDVCMAVGVMTLTTVATSGFTQNGQGYDQPTNDSDWPNAQTNGNAHVSVWLR